MVPDATPSATVESPTDHGNPGPIVNGLIGGVAGVVLSFVPLSPLLGGGIAGYLTGGRPRDGLVVGGIAGIVMVVPFALGISGVLYLLGVGGAPTAFGLVGLVVLVASALYTVGLGVLGGCLGSVLEDEF